jgi:hypothetical protein
MSKSVSGDVGAPEDPAYSAPLPTERTKALRTFVPWQIYRFIMINIKMFQMIFKSHE